MSTVASFTNVSVQKFASEGDAALFERNWGQHGPALLEKLGTLGLMTFTATKVWKDIEKLVFSGVSMKVTAYRGVRQESWSRT